MSNKINRKDLILLLLYAPGSSGEEAEPIDGRTRLMKLLFLLQADQSIDKTLDPKRKYEFQPYHYGPFAKDVYDDLEFLENVGLVEVASKGIFASPADQNEGEKLIEDTSIGEGNEEMEFVLKEERYKLTTRGIIFVKENLSPKEIPVHLLKSIRDLKLNFASQPLSSLLRYVYSNYPKYAEKSKIKDLISS